MKQSFNKWLRLLPVIAWMGVIYLFSADSGEASAAKSSFLASLLGVPEWVVRKGAHMTEFAVLAVLLMWFFQGLRKLWNRNLFWSWLLASCYASTDEFHQLFSGGRCGQLRDVGIDAAGALIGLILLTIVHKIMDKINSESSE